MEDNGSECSTRTWSDVDLLEEDVSNLLYHARCMVQSHFCFQWMLLGDLRVRCISMSDMVFMMGVRRAVVTYVLQVCYRSQTFRFIPSGCTECLPSDWPGVLITVHNFSLNIQVDFIRRCVAAWNLRPFVLNIQMGIESCGDEQPQRKYCDLLLTDGRLFKRLRKAFRRCFKREHRLHFTSTLIP